MTEAMRIPEWTDKSHAGMNSWFSKMADSGLLFHPDDSPDTIVTISGNTPVFSADECMQLNETLDEMFDSFGNEVYEAAIPVFLKCMGIRCDN